MINRQADDRQHRIQGPGRAQNDLAAQGILKERRVVNVHEAVDLLVGNEQQDEINRILGGVHIVFAGDFLEAAADVLQEAFAVVLPGAVGGGAVVSEVVVQGELGVQVDLQAAGQEKGVVGAAVPP